MRLIDFMPVEIGRHTLIRIIEGIEGAVPLDFVLRVRFGYGAYAPWITRPDGYIEMTTAPDALALRTTAPLDFDDENVRGEVTVRKGEKVSFELTWHLSYTPPPAALDVQAVLADTERRARQWSGRSTFKGRYAEAVNRSLLALEGMIYAPSGGIVAAPTAGLPEEIGGVRNWDYRYCWLRDATLTLHALMIGSYVDEASAWRQWLLNAAAGAPSQAQIMYGVSGEHRLTEFEASWLPGYEESRPVRIGNAASEQFQLDVYGEVIGALYEAGRLGVPEARFVQSPALKLLNFVESAWQRPDNGIWEVRGGRRHFVHSKVMAWVAADRMIRTIEELTRPDDRARDQLPRLRSLRAHIHRDVCDHGFDTRQNSFTQAYNSQALDATSLLIPTLGFLPANNPRVQGTIRAVEKELVRDGFVLRYRTDHANDGLPGSEGAFLACSFWLVDAYALSGRRQEAEALFERLLSLRNDLGLLSEEYEPSLGRLIGNFPQAFSHLSLIHSASVLEKFEAPRARTDGGQVAVQL